MSKTDTYRQDLIDLFDRSLTTGNADQLYAYIAANSNLPGPRGNLELAAAFAEMVKKYAEHNPEKLAKLCADMAAIPAEEAPVNNPRELIPFCGVVGIGVIGSMYPKFFGEAMAMLKTWANDSRWRMREAVAMALQRLMVSNSRETASVLLQWSETGSILEMRAAAAAVADPGLLKNKEIAAMALTLHHRIFERVLKIQARKTEDFRVLRKGLGYTLSLVVQAVPQEGFEFMHQLIETQDSDLLWVVKENLKKSRLTRNFPKEVDEGVKHLKNYKVAQTTTRGG